MNTKTHNISSILMLCLLLLVTCWLSSFPLYVHGYNVPVFLDSIIKDTLTSLSLTPKSILMITVLSLCICSVIIVTLITKLPKHLKLGLSVLGFIYILSVILIAFISEHAITIGLVDRKLLSVDVLPVLPVICSAIFLVVALQMNERRRINFNAHANR